MLGCMNDASRPRRSLGQDLYSACAVTFLAVYVYGIGCGMIWVFSLFVGS